MLEKSGQFLLSEAASLRRIKFAQFRAQVPALVLLALAIALNAFFPSRNLYSLALALALVAIAWYLFIGLSYRFRQKILQPPASALVSPLQGKVSFIRHGDGVTLLGIRKIMLDRVEIRSPHSSCRLDDGVLLVDGIAGKVSFRFNFRRIEWFPKPDFRAGTLIGMAVGAGTCTVSLPGKPALPVVVDSPLDAGDIILEEFSSLPGQPLREPELILAGKQDPGTKKESL